MVERRQSPFYDVAARECCSSSSSMFQALVDLGVLLSKVFRLRGRTSLVVIVVRDGGSGVVREESGKLRWRKLQQASVVRDDECRLSQPARWSSPPWEAPFPPPVTEQRSSLHPALQTRTSRWPAAVAGRHITAKPTFEAIPSSISTRKHPLSSGYLLPA